MNKFIFKAVLSLLIPVFILSFLGILSLSEVNAALGPCPGSANFGHSRYTVKDSDSASFGLSVSSSLGITKVFFYFGDGQSKIVDTYIDSGTTYADALHTYTEWGDFSVSVALGNDEEFLYSCISATPLEVYSYYALEDELGSNFKDPGMNTVTFDANTDLPQALLDQYGTDNIIGVVGIVNANVSAVGGDRDSSTPTVDLGTIRIRDSSNNTWGQINSLYGDVNVSDSNTFWTAIDNPATVFAPSLAQRTNLIKHEIRRPQNTYIGGVPVPNPTPYIQQNSQAQSGLSIYWRPRSVPGPPPPPVYDSWTFISSVIDEDTDQGVANSRLELWASDKWVWPPNGPNAPTIAEATIGPIDSCDTVVSGGPYSEKGYCPLTSPVHHPFFFVKKVTNPSGYSSDAAECNCSYTPSRACDLAARYCTDLGTEHIRTYYGNPNVGGTWGGHVFKVEEQPNVSPWWQVKDADVLGNNLTSQVPSGQRFLSDGAGGFPGVVIFEGTLSFGSGTLSSKNWNADTDYGGSTYTYSYFSQFVPDSGVKDLGAGDVNVDAAVLTSGTADANGYYWVRKSSNGNVTIQGNMNLGNNKVILLMDQGDLNVNTNISVNDGTGFFMVLSSGDITVASSVTSMEGVYFAQGDFHSGTGGAGSDSQLVVRGTVMIRGDAYLERDLGANNSTTPAELFEFAPHFFFNFPEAFSGKRVSWSQIVS